MSSRAGIYYWKCDREAALHGTLRSGVQRDMPLVMDALARELRSGGGPDLRLVPAGGQGNHLTFDADTGARRYFVRVEDGPEQDDYLEVESALLQRLGAAGIPVPAVYHCDVSRTRVPFAFHLIEPIADPDLNSRLKAGNLDLSAVCADIGHWIAQWQSRIAIEGFGPFDLADLRAGKGLKGLYATAGAYFYLNLDRHLRFLCERGFFGAGMAAGIAALLDAHRDAIELAAPCLVHKDMALWNVLGTSTRVTAIIDWDDAVGGDALDDLSLLACFHPAAAVRAALDAYTDVRPLPEAWHTRFWLHLVRNLIVKAVIRVGAGYFERSDPLFILGTGGGPALKSFTLARLDAALDALRERRVAVDFS